MSRRYRGHVDKPSKLPCVTKLSFERFCREACQHDTMSQVINHIGGQIMNMLKPDDSWYLEVMAWMKNLSDVPTVYDVELPEHDRSPPKFGDP